MSLREIHGLQWVEWEKEVLDFWKRERVFERIQEERKKGAPRFVFFEGPPSANGKPGIHHMLSRTLKDTVCRFFTMRGYYVLRKGGWDTHGLPVELEVEKKLGIRKRDIGKVISVEEFNRRCREEVLRYKSAWEAFTERMGFWLDLQNAYITFDRKYIESLWWAVSQLYQKGLLYRDYTIVPYSPAAGTALSQHELNLPGCYREVEDLSPTVLFASAEEENLYYLAWTTTPWTLLSNVALAVHPEEIYVEVETAHPYTHEPIRVILAKARLHEYFDPALEDFPPDSYEGDPYHLPYRILRHWQGKELAERRYHPLFPLPDSLKEDVRQRACRIVYADFVTTDEGTGIVHIAPAHGADDFHVARQWNLPMLLRVDTEGKFTEDVERWKGRPVKNFYDEPNYQDVNEEIVEYLFSQKQIFRVEKYRHTYPHCWRTDKPVIYYPMKSWFIRVEPFRERLVEWNRKIRWQPPSIGEHRFGNWLASAVDWNLSRNRYWGTPLPIWMTEDEQEIKCIGSLEELRREVQKAREAGVMLDEPDWKTFDPHRPHVDRIVLVSPSGKPMYRCPDVMDVWFDSGAMPFAQWHYPFENEEVFREQFPADFIAEGVDQTRGWFYTLHVLAVLLFDSVAFRSVIVNGLVLDRHGNKMSKRLGNVVDPVELMEKYGADAVRWYLLSANPPWENLRFDPRQIEEGLRKHMRALANTYQFFAMYANIDGFSGKEPEIPFSERPLIDRWLLARLSHLSAQLIRDYEAYELTRVVRTIQEFIVEDLSNWYVRVNRRRFWKSEYNQDKISAYQTLATALEWVARWMAPVAPFFSEWLFQNLREVRPNMPFSVHATSFPEPRTEWEEPSLLQTMAIARQIVHMAHSLRKQQKIKLRQPIRRIRVHSARPEVRQALELWEPLILQEINTREVEWVDHLENVHQHAGPWVSRSEGDLTIALDTTITPELEREGKVREFINRIQQTRKKLGLSVTERIHLQVERTSETEAWMKSHGKHICEETLAVSWSWLPESEKEEGSAVEVDVYGQKLKISIKPVSRNAPVEG